MDKAPFVGYMAVLCFWGSPKSNYNFIFPKNNLDNEPWPKDYSRLVKGVVKQYLQDKYITHYRYVYSGDNQGKEKKEDISQEYEFEEQPHVFGKESRLA